MQIYSTYSVKIKHYNQIFKETTAIYRKAVDFFINVALDKWNEITLLSSNLEKQRQVEIYTVKTKKNPSPEYDFGIDFYKFPSYLRRAAISDAIGKVSSYKSNLANWENENEATRGKMPAIGGSGNSYPAMYKDNMFIKTGTYTAKIKVYIRNTWDWLDVELRKSDVDYILHHCKERNECVPALTKRGREWFLDFPFKENVKLNDTELSERIILAVDLGINNACACSVMMSDGTVIGRKFLNLPREKDSLNHSINRIKKAQQHGNRKMPRLWAKTNGINNDISVKTAQFIIDTAVLYNADVVVFEHLDLQKKKRGSKKQRLHLWKAKSVQKLVTNKAHRLGIRISHVNAWKTSSLAYDGSGKVTRGTYFHNGKEKYNYSICVFPNGKTYNCDLNASYNIGARYFIREILKSLSETTRLDVLAKVPKCSKRSTCTLSTLISLNAVLTA